MKKIIALTGLTAVLALAGCGAEEPSSEPAAQATQEVEPAQAEPVETATPGTSKVWEVQDPDTWTKYKFDFTKPYSDELTEATDEIFKKSGADEGEWYKVTIDNTEGRDTGTLSYAEIAIVDEAGEQHFPTADIAETLNYLPGEYPDVDAVSADEYNAWVDVSNEWLDRETDAVPGAKAEALIFITDMPDTIERVYLNNNEATPAK